MVEFINKQAAMDIVKFECGKWLGLAKTIIDEFETLPTANQMLHGYTIEQLAFIAALLQKEDISPEELKDIVRRDN